MKASYAFHAKKLRNAHGRVIGVTPMDRAIEDLSRSGGSTKLDPAIEEPWICDLIGVTPIVLGEMDDEEIASHVGYRLGQNIARAHAEHKAGPTGRGGSDG